MFCGYVLVQISYFLFLTSILHLQERNMKLVKKMSEITNIMRVDDNVKMKVTPSLMA